MNHNDSGFTLIELLVTVSISAILLGIAVPSFQTFVLDNRSSAQITSLLSTLYLARSEAIKRDEWVVVCKKNADSDNCVTSGDWTQGWIVFVDTNRNAFVDAGEEILRVRGSLADTSQSFSASANVADYIAFDPIGLSRLVNGAPQSGKMMLCDRRGLIATTPVIVQNANGTSHVIKASEDASITSCIL